jgi:hypothetical protein
MFKKPFNSKVGEQRECKICGESFHTLKPRWRCKKCVAKINFDTAKKKYGDSGLIPTGKWAGMKPKEKYPFDNRSSEANNRFCKIRTGLSNAWKEYRKTGDRSIITKHYDNQLNEIRENGIMEWILDRRADSDKKNMEVKSKTKTNIEYPNTRDMPYE